jgi:hypothetical protein
MTRVRPALFAAVLASSAFGGLLALESAGSNAAAPPASVVDTVRMSDSTTAGTSPEHTRHCTDGNGADATKNKHCRGVSGAQ